MNSTSPQRARLSAEMEMKQQYVKALWMERDCMQMSQKTSIKFKIIIFQSTTWMSLSENVGLNHVGKWNKKGTILRS